MINRGLRIGVDIGGTFTDFCLFDDIKAVARLHKRLTTPDDPSRAVIEGIATLLENAKLKAVDIDTVIHGTTLVTNAVIERKGSPTGMLVTKGFADVLNIARERRYDLFDLTIKFPDPIVSRRLRFEVPGRLRHDGSVLESLELAGVAGSIAAAIDRDRIESVAVCFLHSHINPVHENEAVQWLRERFPQLSVTGSADTFPFMREYERWTTACVNAYVQPVVERYLDRLERGLAQMGFQGQFYIMNSSGGTLTSGMARRYPVRLLESGPAAGALMSATHGRRLGIEQVLSFDMGGTTAKGCIIQDGTPLKRYDLEVARVHEFKQGSGLPVKIPVLDMIEIGAGGGSIAQIDPRGLIQVGPQSAGANPGPACYGLGGTRPTLTDANLLLGYLGADSFLGGTMHLDKAAATAATEATISAPLGISLMHAAWGIHEVINEDVARAFRVHASERGIDYRRCSMIVFGGSGPLHGTRIARKLRVPQVICPTGAGVMSAFGLLVSPVGFEIARSRRLAVSKLTEASFRAEIDSLGEEVVAVLARAGVPRADLSTNYRLDIRYEGQGYEIEVPLPVAARSIAHSDLVIAFEKEYKRLFGLTFPGRGLEIVNWKAEAITTRPADRYYSLSGVTPTRALKGYREIWLHADEAMKPCPVYDRYSLVPGMSISGPALIEENESTCVIHEGDQLTVDQELNLVIRIGMH